MTIKQKVFVAYPGRDKALATLLSTAVSHANSKPIQIHYESWEFNDIPGNPLISPIVEGIDDSTFIVADITYLNLNVIYEIGYAIGRRKRAFLIRHAATAGDKDLAKAAGIFDTLGYREYDDFEDLTRRLTSHIEELPLQFEETLDRKAPVYVVEPSSRGDAETMMVSRLKKARYRYRSYNPNEDPRLSAVDAIRQVSASSGVLVCLQQDSVPDSATNNVRALFVAGFSHGLRKPTLILSPYGLSVPLDIIDRTKTFKHPDDIPDHIQSLSLEITEYQQQVDPPPVQLVTPLQSLRVGDPTAENEMTTLAAYYLPIDQYNRAIQGDVNLVVGRKGSGKTALFLQLRDRLRSDKRNIVVDLKPEGYQLLKLKEDMLSFLSDGSRQHLVTAFWEYLLLLEVAYKLLEKDKHTYKNNHLVTALYLELRETYDIQDFSTEGDFSERLASLSRRIASEYQAKYGDAPEQRLTSEQVTQLLYRHDIRKLRSLISKYLAYKQAVWILFDNLDKGWSTHGVDEIDSLVLRCLINAGRAIERDMRKDEHFFHCIVFVRNDVYEHLMRNSSDYGKEMRAVLDWTDRDLLREVLRLRLVSGLEKTATNTQLEQLIPVICVSHFQGQEVVDYMIDRSLMRPRNLLKIFIHSRGFASNLNHDRISDEDLEKGMAAYSQDLLLELDRELTDISPGAQNVLYQFLDSHSDLSKADLQRVLQDAKVPNEELEKITNFLLYYGVIGLRTVERDLYIYDVDYDIRKLAVRIERAGDNATFRVNPAFWPALSIQQAN